MKKFMDWITNKFAPKMNKIARNPWVLAIQESINVSMPVIFIGSIVTLLNILGNFISMPDISAVSTFSMGLLSVYLAFLVPYTLMEKKRHNKSKKEAGIVGVGFFLMLTSPSFEDGSISFMIESLGMGGMLAALLSGLLVGMVMSKFANHSFFKEDTTIAEFITVWFDTFIPMLLILLIGWFVIFQMGINMVDVIYTIFSPLISLGDSYIGFIILNFLCAFLYTFGISSWLLDPIDTTITMTALNANIVAAKAGVTATAINCYGIGTYISMGGTGMTLGLVFMMLFFAKSKKLKIMGKVTVIPSLFNINEPLVFGAPLAFNPIMMVPMWIASFVISSLTYLGFYFNIIPKITQLWSFWYLPKPISQYVLGGLSGLTFGLVMFALSCLIYYPFFKIYDRQCCEEEAAAQAKEIA